ncbi:MAG: glutaconate CoA-transferase [Peptococcaceae bacterium]|nr:MAG: glutaconate CoA-transferase [Peptococcaceae bacterium]
MQNGVNDISGIYEVLERRFRLPENEGADKVCALAEAVRKHVRPGMALHFGQNGARWPAAAVFEVARQFWGTKQDFTLVGISMNVVQSVLVHGGLVKKLVTTYCGDPYNTPAPNGVYQRVYLDGSVEIENWTILTLPLRLKAAAMGVAYTTTNSIIGSSMEEENSEKGLFKVVEDPFGSDRKVGLMPALYPDLSFVHGWAADRYGNTLILSPSAENTFGAMASRNGVIVTAEKIVDTEYIRKNAHLMALPGDYVRCVCEAPFGAHPSGMVNIGLPDFDGYAEDYDFVDGGRMASKDPESFERWVREWVLGCEDHQAYLRKLGADRILYLKGKSHADAWRYDLSVISEEIAAGSYTALEMALVATGREIKKRIKAGNLRTILAGAGIANLGTWLAYYDLKAEGYDVELMAEVGLYGYNPRPLDPAVFNQRNFFTCKALTDTHTLMGIYMSGANNRCLGVLGFGQIDKKGNINTTKIPGKTYIAGSGGANDIASNVREIVAVGTQDKRRFLDRVSYVTSPGERVRTLVSDLGIYEKLPGEDEFTLTAYFPAGRFSSVEENVRHIKENCGWDLKVARNPAGIKPPAGEELIMLRLFDPRRHFLGEPAS